MAAGEERLRGVTRQISVRICLIVGKNGADRAPAVVGKFRLWITRVESCLNRRLDLLKEVRTHLIEAARPVMEKMVEEITGVKLLSLHDDISTTTAEEVVVFTLTEPPSFRATRKK